MLLVLAGVLSLVVLRRRRRRQARVEPPLPDTRFPEKARIDPTSDIDWATILLAKPPTVARPLPDFYLSNANGTDGLILGQRPYMPPSVPDSSDIPRVGFPRVSIITQPAVVRPSITSSLANHDTRATTFIVNASASGSLPSETQPIRAATSQEHNFEDLSAVTSIMSSKNSMIDSGNPSIASSAPLVPRSTRCLTDEEVDFVASLYRQQLSPPDVARIIDNMLDEGEIGNKGDGPNNGIVVTQPKPIQPSAYDFKSGGQG